MAQPLASVETFEGFDGFEGFGAPEPRANSLRNSAQSRRAQSPQSGKVLERLKRPWSV